MTDYGDLALFIARNIVNNKDSVSVRVRQNDRQQIVEIKTSTKNINKIIDKNSRNIDAIHTMMRTTKLRHRQRVQVDVN